MARTKVAKGNSAAGMLMGQMCSLESTFQLDKPGNTHELMLRVILQLVNWLIASSYSSVLPILPPLAKTLAYMVCTNLVATSTC
jgi:hypothetical protein